MTRLARYGATLLTLGAIGAIGLAPVATAATGPAHAVNGVPNGSGGVAGQWDSGTDPLVPIDTGADPYVLLPQGDGLSF